MRGVLSVRKPARFVAGAFALVSALLLSGCGPTLQGGPGRLYTDAEERSGTRTTLAYIKAKYLSEPREDFRMFYRNYYIGENMKYINRQYYAYETGLTQDRQKIGLGLGVTSIGLSTAGSLDAVGRSTLFSGLAGAVTGVKGQYESEVLFAKTLQIIQAQMRSNRDTVATHIFKGMKLSTSDYPLSLAEADLEDYYGAGTLTAGVLKTAQSVSQDAQVAETAKNLVVEGKYSPDQSSDILRSYILVDGVWDDAREAQLQTVLDGIDKDLEVFQILDLEQYAKLRQDLVAAARARGIPL